MKRPFPLLVSIVLLALMPVMASSQGMPPMPATPVPGDAPVGTLAEFNLRHLPTPHAEVWFLRMELEPGGLVPASPPIGPMVLYVESGELSLEIDGPVMLPGADRAEEPGTMTLGAGDSLQLTAETSASLGNEGDTPVVFLTLFMYPAELEEEGSGGDEPTGMSVMGIAIGTAEFVDVPATVRMERVIVQPGEAIEPSQTATPRDMGMELGAVETGSAEVMLENTGRANVTWPGMLNSQESRPQPVPMTATVELATGDAYAFHGSTLTWTNTGDEPLTILRVVINPKPMQ